MIKPFFGFLLICSLVSSGRLTSAAYPGRVQTRMCASHAHDDRVDCLGRRLRQFENRIAVQSESGLMQF